MNADQDSTTHPDEPREFRCKREIFWWGIFSASVAFAFAIVSTLAALWNIDGSFTRPLLAAAVMGGFWSFIGLGGVWMIAASVYERLYVSRDCIRMTDVFRSRAMKLDELNHARWRRLRGNLVLRDAAGRVVVHFANYAQRLELIQLLRDRIDRGLQEDWDEFASQFLRSRDEARRDARRAFRLYAAVLFAFAAVFAYVAIANRPDERGYLLIVGVNVAGGIACLLWARREPEVDAGRRPPPLK
ncbi:MAG: hypothetical protein WD066_10075 [Planctomycetaceae bacterium]